jgi:N-acetylglucosaminyldiphosphoundecaprenol N-acetyl-beta-D-mannosaminyltransferase
MDQLLNMGGFHRDVWCLLGLPFDALTMSQAVAQVRAAAASRSRCFISTANLNFLITATADEAFRESVVDSDLSLVDGMPLVWLARVLGLPIRERVAGSDLFETLRWEDHADALPGVASHPVAVFFFGGPEGAAEKACARVNAEGAGLRCVGWHDPGFVGLEQMSSPEIVEKINASGADFLVVSLGARKGQAWIMRNLARLRVPVVSHLGAVVNFLAGSVRRAPAWMRRTGLEWLWRIKEEPVLLRRYAWDGLALLRLVLTRVLPYLAWRWWRRFGLRRSFEPQFSVRVLVADGPGDDPHATRTAKPACRVTLTGPVLAGNLGSVREAFREAVASGPDVAVDLAAVTDLDGAFLGLLMVLRKQARAAGRQLRIERASGPIRRLFRLNAAAYLLE